MSTNYATSDPIQRAIDHWIERHRQAYGLAPSRLETINGHTGESLHALPPCTRHDTKGPDQRVEQLAAFAIGAGVPLDAIGVLHDYKGCLTVYFRRCPLRPESEDAWEEILRTAWAHPLFGEHADHVEFRWIGREIIREDGPKARANYDAALERLVVAAEDMFVAHVTGGYYLAGSGDECASEVPWQSDPGRQRDHVLLTVAERLNITPEGPARSLKQAHALAKLAPETRRELMARQRSDAREAFLANHPSTWNQELEAMDDWEVEPA